MSSTCFEHPSVHPHPTIHQNAYMGARKKP